MKRITALSLVFFLGQLPNILIFTLTSPNTAIANIGNPSTASNPENVYSAINYAESSLPLEMSTAAIKDFEELHDASLQTELDHIVNANPRWVKLSKIKALSIGIVDMHNPMNARFAAINSNEMMYAASLPKIAILLACEDAIACGKLKETKEVKQDMRQMIAKSSNAAASRMYERVGVEHIASVLQDAKYNLYDQQNGGGLWVGKPYGKAGGGRKGDPLKNLSHAATVKQVSKFYYKLAFGQLVNEERLKDMLNVMSKPELHHKFVSVLDRVAPDAKVYRKSGSWQNWHADSALVWSKDRRYIVVVLANDSNGEMMLRDLMRKIDTALVSTT
ncbi:MAG: serine hydrolase [Saprospiraceae bacterium]|nr:serine hydrolase [Saprospiraceae bacterium]